MSSFATGLSIAITGNEGSLMDQITYRLAKFGDIEPLLEFWDAHAEHNARPADDAVSLNLLINTDPSSLMLALDNGAIIGSVIAGRDGWRASIYRLAVHPDFRGQGVGRELLSKATIRLREPGARRIGAVVLDENALGQKFWSGVVFHKQLERSRWINDV